MQHNEEFLLSQSTGTEFYSKMIVFHIKIKKLHEEFGRNVFFFFKENK